MELTGQSIIGYRRGGKEGRVLNGLNPATGEVLSPAFYSASGKEVDECVGLAGESFAPFARTGRKERAEFLRTIAKNLLDAGDALVERAVSETGLPPARIRGERERTCNQLRFFADMVEEGSWVDARIDRGDATRTPAPRPDVRSMLRPLGPVAVFCASNFPLAFSVAGGDTASALAAGNPVIVLAHYSHPGTAEMAGTAIRDAALAHQLPEGVFSLLYDAGHDVAHALVKHPGIKGAGFTGSHAGGMALVRTANSRPEPIPFYAEMGSVNPVFILPGAIRSRGQAIAKDLHASATAGVGQFCTNPGVVITLGESDAFVSQFSEWMANTPPAAMLNRNIADAYRRGVSARSGQSHVRVRTLPPASADSSPASCHAGTAVFETDAESWLSDAALQKEVFGPATLVVHAKNQEDLLKIAGGMEGNLTATILGDPEDLAEFSALAALLERKVGRVIFNAFPTGVEVCEAMVHGGPYPATSDGRSTSVGGRAVLRFTRPVCYQNFPDAALPAELQQANPLGIRRMEDGRYVGPPSPAR